MHDKQKYKIKQLLAATVNVVYKAVRTIVDLASTLMAPVSICPGNNNSCLHRLSMQIL